MTFKELAQAILLLPTQQLDMPVGVWPPTQCPATEIVPVTGVNKTRDGQPVLVTGKNLA